ncbi:hypothetical protein ABIB95_002569 [Bradyrhizobium sp. LA2.1]
MQRMYPMDRGGNMMEREACAVRSLAPFLRGEGWGEGLLRHKR